MTSIITRRVGFVDLNLTEEWDIIVDGIVQSISYFKTGSTAIYITFMLGHRDILMQRVTAWH